MLNHLSLALYVRSLDIQGLVGTVWDYEESLLSGLKEGQLRPDDVDEDTMTLLNTVLALLVPVKTEGTGRMHLKLGLEFFPSMLNHGKICCSSIFPNGYILVMNKVEGETLETQWHTICGDIRNPSVQRGDQDPKYLIDCG